MKHEEEPVNDYNKRMKEYITDLVKQEVIALGETKKKDSRGTVRDYKKEYAKYGSSKKAKKYRAELNQYNRKKGTYGNGDGKDASHKGGKIVGFEAQSKNRGRAEKSRLKKEARTINVEPNWEGLYRFMMNMKKTDKSAFSRVTNKMGTEWKKLEKMAEKNKWTESVNEKVIKVSKKDDIPGNPMKMSGEEKIKKLVYSGSIDNKGSYEIKGNKLNVIGIRPRDKGFFVRHFTMKTGFRKSNLYYDGVHWQGKKKF